MGSFLQKLKKKQVDINALETSQGIASGKVLVKKTDNPDEASGTQDNEPISQLYVDIFQTNTSIVIYAQISGSSSHDFSVVIEGDGDIVTIRGQRNRPDGDVFEVNENEVEHVLSECTWGKFYRQIILPTEVDASKADAKMKNGVLVIFLPLKEATGGEVRLDVKEV